MTSKLSATSAPPGTIAPPLIERARFAPGDIVRHRMFDFRGVVFDIDPVFSNSEEWYQAIPEAIRPTKEQPYYHLLAENEESSYIAYVSQQNLVADADSGPVDHPQIEAMFDGLERGRYRLRAIHRH
jgi:heat shock protein HspQ